jgi:FtsP/CotA-like multicopper oxidase with cupredoxin domain
VVPAALIVVVASAAVAEAQASAPAVQFLRLWGYNGSAPGPTIEVVDGDRVRILFENRLPEPTTVHWHGLEVPIAMDGVPAISQPEVEPGGRFTYEFTLHQPSTRSRATRART